MDQQIDEIVNEAHVDGDHHHLQAPRDALDSQENQIRDAVLRMGTLVEAAIRQASRALATHDAALALDLVKGDAIINETQRAVSRLIVTSIATQQPVARDLRYLLTLDHVTYELERMGDHASSVAKQVIKLAPEPPLDGYVHLQEMAERAAVLLHGVLRALVDGDAALAREVAVEDDEIDRLNHATFDRAIELMRQDPANVERGTRIVIASHYLERIGDRATNIAEDIVYLETGDVEDLKSVTQRPIRVLFVCTGNSARSVMAEALLRQHGGPAFEVHSAGTEPKGVNPLTLHVLAEAGIDGSFARSKSVEEFAGQSFDYVVTVCDQARQSCPVFPGAVAPLHWGYEDPAAALGTHEERLAVFRRVFTQLGERVHLFVPLALRDQATTAAAT